MKLQRLSVNQLHHHLAKEALHAGMLLKSWRQKATPQLLLASVETLSNSPESK